MTKNTKHEKNAKSYAKYSGLGFQMAGVFLVGILGGQFLDNYFELENNYFTIGLTLLLFVGFMYKLYITLIKE